jgi:hypothetical protein
MNKGDAKKLRHHIFLGDTIDRGVWEFEDKLPKFVSDTQSLTIRYHTWSDKGEWIKQGSN